MKKKVTSTDIAHAAGVSQSTVSMILNKKYDVSFAKDTVERVENAAKELEGMEYKLLRLGVKLFRMFG